MSRFDIYAPLNEFEWAGGDFELSRGLWLRRHSERPDLHGIAARLAADEEDTISMADHWLEFQWDEGTTPSPAETVNLTLLALWLAKPTKVHVAYRFELGSGPAVGKDGWSRLLDRFAWVPGGTHEALDDVDLQSASRYIPVLCDLCRARGRLADALILTITGCWSHRWQVALICHAAAAETILTYATGPGITYRLSISYACLIETQPSVRDRAFNEFRDLYRVRSDIMHGRSHNVALANRLRTLARFGDILRNLWRTVLSSPPLMQALEGSDAQRQAWFAAREAGYVPPP